MTQTTDKKTDSGQPVSLRENGTQYVPVAQPGANTNTIILVVLVAVVFLIAGLIIATMMGGSDKGITEGELNSAVAEAVGTQVALSQPVAVGSGMSQQEVQQAIDYAVATQVQALIPTNTPIPPTPTIIPNDVADDDDPFVGRVDAPIVIVEFSDFQCGFCSRFATDTLPQILEAYPDQVKFVYRDFTIFGEESVNAAEAAQCANDQGKFLDMHDRIFANHDSESPLTLNEETLVSFAGELDLDENAFSECLTGDKYRQEILDDYSAAVAYGLQGTPGFIINGVVYTFGAQPFDTFKQIIDAELEKAS